MPQVPSYGGAPKVTPSGGGTPGFNIPVGPESFGVSVGRGLSQVGAEGQQATEAITQHRVQFQQLDNKAVADKGFSDFLNAANKVLFDPDSGYYNKFNKDAVDNYKPTIDQLNTLRDNLASGMNTPARLEYDAATRRQLSMMVSDASRHAAQQRRSWLTLAADGTISAAQQTAALNYNNPVQRDAALKQVEDAAIHKSMVAELPPEAMQAEVAKVRSQTWTPIIQQQAVDDPHGAKDTFEQNKSQLLPNELTALDRYLKTVTEPVDIKSVADGIINNVVGNFDPKNWFQKGILPQEGGGPGVVSPAGAKGPAQMMDETGQRMAARLGHPYNPNDNVAEGQEYFNDLVKRFGNPLLATAAYNAGPQAVSDWVAGTDHVLPDGKHTNPRLLRLGTPGFGQEQAWIKSIPYQETRNYVANIVQRVGLPGGQAQSPDMEQQLPVWLSQADAVGQALYPNDPAAQQQLEQQVRNRAGTIKAGQDATRATARDNLLEAMLTAESSGNPYDNVQDLLKSYQGAQSDWATLLPREQQPFLKMLNTQANAITLPRMQTYQELSGLAANDPKKFLDANVLAADIPNSWKKELIGKQNAIRKDMVKAEQSNQNINHAMHIAPITSMLSSAGIKVGDKEYNQVTGAMLGEIENFKSQHGGRNPNDTDIAKIGANLMAARQKGFLGFGKQANYEVPKESEQAIRDQAKKLGVARDLTDGEVAQIYFRTHPGG